MEEGGGEQSTSPNYVFFELLFCKYLRFPPTFPPSYVPCVFGKMESGEEVEIEEVEQVERRENIVLGGGVTGGGMGRVSE